MQTFTQPQGIPPRSHEEPAWRWVFYSAQVAFLAAVYFGAARLGLTMAFVAEQVTAVWPTTGIALAALVLFGYRLWPGIALGAFLANATANAPLATVASIAVGNTLEALVGAWLLRRLVQFDPALGRVKDVLSLVGLAAGLSTMVSATIGATSLCLGGVKPWTSYPTMWGVWWLGDAMGDLVVAPLLLTWAGWHCLPWRPRRVAEAGTLFLALVAVSLLVFAGPIAYFSFHPLAYTVFPFVIWAALRFGQPAVTLVTFLASGVAIWGTVGGHGPFAARTTQESLILLQIYMGVVAVTALVLSAVTIEREQAKEAARQSRDELHLTLEAARVGTWNWDQHTGKVCWSDNLEAIHGLAPGTFGGTFEAFLDGVHPMDRNQVLQALHRAVEEVKDYEIEYRSVGVDGRLRWLGGRGRMLHDAGGKPLRMHGICADITTRKQAEEMRSRLAAIVESSEDAILSESLDGIILTWNRAAEKMYGYGAAEVVGRSIRRLVPPERAGEVRAILDQVMRGERLENYETLRLRKDGTPIEVALNISPMPDATGRVAGASVIGRDITTRKRSERRLAAVHAVTSALAQSAGLGEAAGPVLQTVGMTLRCDLGVLWEVDVAADVLRCAGLWHLPGIKSTAFERFREQIVFARGEGLPGRVWGTGEPAWIPDAQFPRSVADRREGPCGALALPLRTDGNVLGILELFGPDLRQPDAELFALLTGLASQIAQFIERRQAERVVHARDREFSLARTIQQGLLPKAPPVLPGLDIAGASHPAQETGGDYFDFIPMSDGHWGIAIGDASGHGIGSALLVAETRAYLRAFALTNTDPGQVLDRVNQGLVEDITADHFVTLFLGRLDPATRCLVYSNAGHLPAYLLDGRGEVKRVLRSTGLPLGLGPTGALPKSPAVCLEPGDLLFLLSDGIVEASPGDGPLFGMERTLKVVRAHRHQPAGEIITALLRHVREWAGSAQADDMTAIVIKVGG
jgi:PAS domain S-box-containing protein